MTPQHEHTTHRGPAPDLSVYRTDIQTWRDWDTFVTESINAEFQQTALRDNDPLFVVMAAWHFAELLDLDARALLSEYFVNIMQFLAHRLGVRPDGERIPELECGQLEMMPLRELGIYVIRVTRALYATFSIECGLNDAETERFLARVAQRERVH